MKYVDDECYHIYNRGAHKSKIFFLEDNYRYCLRLVKKYASQYDVSILAYCLMPNHYHLVCQQEDGGSISRFLQTTFNAYSQAVNKQQRHSGTLFEGRARAKHIATDSYLLQVVRYLHFNPVEAGIVMKPEMWRYSDYKDWIGDHSGGLELSEGVKLRNALMGSGSRYREFVELYREVEREGIREFLFDE